MVSVFVNKGVVLMTVVDPTESTITLACLSWMVVGQKRYFLNLYSRIN